MFDRSSLPFGGSGDSDSRTQSGGGTNGESAGRVDEEGRFDPPDAFAPESLPDPGDWLGSGGATVLTGADHVAVRAAVREAFDERGVRDATFGYVLTKLERDRAHPDAGLRYARDGRTLRIEFVPTSEFCPQGGSLALAAARALAAERDRHGFITVRVRVADDYHASESVNRRLREAAGETGDDAGSAASTVGDEGQRP